eukprot:291534_1
MKSISTTALIASLIGSSNAFAPSSFTPSSSVSTSTSSSASMKQPAQNGSALHMNLFDRFSRVAKSNLNNIVKNLEDPEKILNQALEDMQSDLVKVRQSYAEVTATQRRLLKQQDQ